MPAPELSPGPYVCLKVADTGVGIDWATREKIFDPYFTTKKLNKGTGLGLSVVHGIVKNYNGAIIVESEPGNGASFEIYLPRIAFENEDSIEIKESDCKTGNERILLVDDDKLIARMVKRMTEGLGYQVAAYFNGADALEAFRTAPDNFDVVVTDMTMPSMTGDRLSLEIKKIRPNVPILLCTGFSEKTVNRKASEIGVDKVLMKPILKRDLANAIRDVLDNR